MNEDSIFLQKFFNPILGEPFTRKLKKLVWFPYKAAIALLFMQAAKLSERGSLSKASKKVLKRILDLNSGGKSVKQFGEDFSFAYFLTRSSFRAHMYAIFYREV